MSVQSTSKSAPVTPRGNPPAASSSSSPSPHQVLVLAEQGKLPELQALAQRHGDKILTVANDGGMTAAHRAAGYGQLATLKYIFGLHPELFKVHSRKLLQSPLCLAAAHNQHAVILWMHQVGIPFVGDVDKDGFTALHTAAVWGHYDTAELVASKVPALLAVLDKNGRTAAQLATEENNLRLADMLKQKSARLPAVANASGVCCDDVSMMMMVVLIWLVVDMQLRR